MKRFVVVVTFPFSDLTGTKRRPALVLAALDYRDLILCQITSQAITGPHAVPLLHTDFEHGALPQRSYIRPEKLFTANESLVVRTLGQISHTKFRQVTDQIIAILTDPGD